MSKTFKPFLHLPFKEQKYRITEGWRYSEKENQIHGYTGHGAVDFELPRGTHVLAAADGWAISSYFWFEIKNSDGSIRKWKDKNVANSLGYFVQIYHPEAKLFSCYGHLEKIAEDLAFYQPRKVGNKYWPVGHKIPGDNLKNYKWATPVKMGQVIGFVGDSGLTLGYKDFPQRPNPKRYPSWDEVHLHFEVFERVGSRKRKKYFDPFGIKGVTEDYQDSIKVGKELGKKGVVLWILDQDGNPGFNTD